MSKRPRRSFTPEQKAAAVIRHLQDAVAVSQICDELDIHPNQFYDWKKQALESLSGAFERRKTPREDARKKRELEQLQDKLSKKDEVIAELLTDHIAPKKLLAGVETALGGAGRA
ncbi:MAG: hypothetical protein MAG453_01832 [Calditrichaeota bacterium]|nr:hypothetical protein [Calditrichota bacterium]